MRYEPNESSSIMTKNSNQYWWPVATTQDMKKGKLLPLKFHGLPIIIFRDANGTAASLPDYCPHRFAPLSHGTLINGEVQCPYHGWRFNSQGKCTNVPGNENVCSHKPILKSINTYESHGLIWLNQSSGESIPLLPVFEQDNEVTDFFYMSDTIHCTLPEAAENFLDGFHTHFVHAGWIRHDKNRQTVMAKIHKLSDGIEVQYSGEVLQSGFISRLLEGDRGVSMGRFRLPGLAEIEYRNSKGDLNLLVSAWLTPMDQNHLRVHARIATRKGIVPSWIKQNILSRLFKVILKQDKNILEKTRMNIESFQENGTLLTSDKQLDTSNDLIGPYIRSLVEGNKIEDFEEKTILLKL